MAGALTFRRAFENKAFNIEDVAAEQCAQLAQSHSLDPSAFVQQFELFAIKSNYDSFDVTKDIVTKFADALPKLAADLLAKQSTNGRARNKHLNAASAARTPLTSRTNQTSHTTPNTKTPALTTPTTGTMASAHSGQVVAQYNWDNDGTLDTTPSPLLSPSHFKFMKDTLADKVEYINGRIMEAHAAVEATGTHTHPVAVASQDTVVSVGRVLCDAAGARLNGSSVLLEGSVDTCQGEHVALDTTAITSVRMFPGQVVAVSGTNPSGHKLMATALRSDFHAPPAMTSMPQLVEFAKQQGRAPLSMVVAAGPFMLHDTLAFEPLAAVAALCIARAPSVLLLCGPFVDAGHPVVSSGQLDVTYEELFQQQVLDYLSTTTPPTTRILMLPTPDDVHLPFCFPQPAINPLQTPTGPNTPMQLTNPALFSMNELVVGVVGVDILRHMGGAEYQKGAMGEHRLSALASHIIQQRSFYPLYPPAPGVPLDAALAPALHLHTTPDILILPSELAPFVKTIKLPETHPGAGDVASVLVINPGLAGKRASLGTAGVVVIDPHAEAAAVVGGAPSPTNGAVEHAVESRAHVCVKKL